MDDNGMGEDSMRINGLNYLKKLLLENPQLKIPAVNLSLGEYRPETPTKAFITPAWMAFHEIDLLDRTIFTIAAGNEGLVVENPAPYDDPRYDDSPDDREYHEGDYSYPAAYLGLKNFIVVAAVDYDKEVPHFRVVS